jgi:hypothetical protein
MTGERVDVRRLAAPGIGLAALVLYWLTAYPDLAGGDGGELVAAAVTGGVIHPPGYPLYAMAARAFSWLPIAATAAGRANLLSAFCDAAAAALLCAAVSRRTASVVAGLAAAAAFAFAPIVWQYATCAEVFALNDLLVAALIWLAVRYEEAADRRFALGGAFAMGLGLSNHHTFLFVAAPVAAWALWRGWSDLRSARFLSLLVGAFAAGLLPYVYLPLAAAGASPVSWGATGTWSGFWTHVLRREYGTLRLAVEGIAGASSSLATLGAWGEAVLGQFAIVGVVLPLVGAAMCVRRACSAPLGAVLVGAAALSVGVVVALGNLPVTDALHRQIVARFWQEPAAVLAILCGEGVAQIERKAPRRLVAAAVGLLLVAPLPWRFGAADRHGSTLVRSYGAEILRAAPPGALLVTKGDLITNTVRYLQAVEGVRPDVEVVDQELLGYAWQEPRLHRAYPDVVFRGARYAPGAPDGFTIKDFIDDNYGKQPILICGGIKPGDLSAESTYGRWPFGLCERVERGDVAVNVDDWVRESEAALPRIDFRRQAHPAGSWEGVVWSDYWEVRQARAAHLLGVAGADPARRRFIGIAADILQGIVEQHPEAPAHVYRNLATALGRRGFDNDAQRALAAKAWRRYLEQAPQGDAQRGAIEKEIARLEGR